MPQSTSFPEDFIPFSQEVFEMVLALPVSDQAAASLYVIIESLSRIKRLEDDTALHIWRVESALVALGLYSKGFPEVQAAILEEIRPYGKRISAEVLASCFDLDQLELQRVAAVALRSLPYAEYLKTPHWERMRERAIARSGGRCQLCNTPPSERMSLHVHHRTYGRVGAEHLDDLIALCEPCHRHFHERLPQSAEKDWWDV